MARPMRRANIYKALGPVNVKMTPMVDNHKNYAGNDANGLLDEQLRRFVAEEGTFTRHLDEMKRLAEEGALRLTPSERGNVKRRSETIERLAAIRWFSLAAGHLYDLRMPKGLPQDQQRRLKVLQRRCLQGSFPPSLVDGPSKGDVEWAVTEARQLWQFLESWRRVTDARGNGPKQRVAK